VTGSSQQGQSPPSPTLAMNLLRSGRRWRVLTGHPRSTCYAVLRRWGLARLDFLDRPDGAGDPPL
jgi:hypothetical protein